MTAAIRPPNRKDLRELRAILQAQRWFHGGRGHGGQFRLAEVAGVIAMATDLGLGLPMEHAVRACLLSTEIGRRAGLGREELSDLFYLTLLRMLGCTADSGSYADLFGDEVAFARDSQHLDYGDPDGFGRWVMESFAVGRPADERQRMIGKLFSYTPGQRRAALAGHCEVARMLASRLGLAGAVADGLGYVFERYVVMNRGEPGRFEPPRGSRAHVSKSVDQVGRRAWK